MVHLNVYKEDVVLRKEEHRNNHSVDMKVLLYLLIYDQNTVNYDVIRTLSSDIKVKVVDGLINFNKYNHDLSIKLNNKTNLSVKDISGKRQNEVLIVDKKGAVVKMNRLIHKCLVEVLNQFDNSDKEYVFGQLSMESDKNVMVLEHILELVD